MLFAITEYYFQRWIGHVAADVGLHWGVLTFERLMIFFLVRWDLQTEECRVLSNHSRPISSLLYPTELGASLSVTVREETDFSLSDILQI
jgi:hypothetical protein